MFTSQLGLFLFIFELFLHEIVGNVLTDRLSSAIIYLREYDSNNLVNIKEVKRHGYFSSFLVKYPTGDY
jgi:hypothetical protein